MDVRYDTYCGLYCGACPVGMANEKGESKVIEELAAQWGRNPDELICGGCKCDITAVFCTGCTIRACARDRGLEFCIDCEEYPCDDLTGFRNDKAPHHSAVLSNLKRLGELGQDKWLGEQMKRWSCPGCGSRFSWYSETCEQCGGKLHNCVSEEETLEE